MIELLITYFVPEKCWIFICVSGNFDASSSDSEDGSVLFSTSSNTFNSSVFFNISSSVIETEPYINKLIVLTRYTKRVERVMRYCGDLKRGKFFKATCNPKCMTALGCSWFLDSEKKHPGRTPC